MLLVGAPPPPPDVVDLFSRLAGALSQGNASAFLKHFDREMPGYGTLEAQVYALVNQANVASSLDIVKDDGDARSRAVELDWILEVAPKEPANPTERRHQAVRCRLEPRGKQWKIVWLDPIGFFAPPHPPS